MAHNLDYLTARLHGRRSRMAEGRRLESLCLVPAFSELALTVFPQMTPDTKWEFQRHLVQKLIDELTGWMKQLEPPGSDLLAWIVARFQIENIKVLLRGLLRHTALTLVEPHLLSLPRPFCLDFQKLAAATSPEVFVETLPAGPLRRVISRALQRQREPYRPFFLEAGLDSEYFAELISRTRKLAPEDQNLVRPILCQEIDTFHLLLSARGRFLYGLPPESLLEFHVPGARISAERFHSMLTAPDLAAVCGLALGLVIDSLPAVQQEQTAADSVIASALEALAIRRFWHLSQRAFRRSHIGLAAVFGYVGVRQIEVANLITLSEALGEGLSGTSLRTRLVPGLETEAGHV